MKRTFAALVGTVSLGLAVGGAQAQDSLSTSAAVAHFAPQEAASFSKQVEDDLAARGVRVAMVFRTGRPRNKLPAGIAYTHGAFWIYRDLRIADGHVAHGYAVYNLYAGDGHAWPATESRLVQDFPLDFVRSSAVDDVAVIVPSPEVQRRMLGMIDSPAYQRLHNPSYSLIANPLRATHQNCNTFMLDVVAAAVWNTTDPASIRADLQANYTPAVVQAGPLMRLFGPVVDRRLRTDDQTGPIRTATYESMTDFMRRNGLLEASYTLAFWRDAAAPAPVAAP